MRRRRIGVMSWAAKNATERCQNTAEVTAFSSSRASVWASREWSSIAVCRYM